MSIFLLVERRERICLENFSRRTFKFNKRFSLLSPNPLKRDLSGIFCLHKEPRSPSSLMLKKVRMTSTNQSRSSTSNRDLRMKVYFLLLGGLLLGLGTWKATAKAEPKKEFLPSPKIESEKAAEKIDIWMPEKYNHHSRQQKMVADMLLKQYSFKETDFVLDVGCGDGKITEEIWKTRIPKGIIVGVDPSISMIEFANRNFSREGVCFSIGKASEILYKAHFDVITSFSSLHWEPKQKDALLGFKRALKPGGAILLAIPGPDPTLGNALQKVCAHPKWSSFFQGYVPPGRVWKPNEYAQLLLDTGFQIRKIELVDRPYLFDKPEDYKHFVEAMLPHLSRVPKDKQNDFLDELTAAVKIYGNIKDSRMKFEVQVLEIIAYSDKSP